MSSPPLFRASTHNALKPPDRTLLPRQIERSLSERRVSIALNLQLNPSYSGDDFAVDSYPTLACARAEKSKLSAPAARRP